MTTDIALSSLPGDWEIGIVGTDAIVKGRIGWMGYKKTDLRESGPVVIGGTNIKSNLYLDLTDLKHIAREKYEEAPNIQLKKGDVLVVQRGNGVGDTAYFNGAIEEATINPTLIILSEFSGDPKFLFYFLTSPQGRKNILALVSGSSIPALYQNHVKQLTYPKPSITEQRAIAGTLSTLDDKIEVNRRMNATLESMARAVFRQWFVDGIDIANWEEKPLDEIADFLNGLALQKFPAESDDYLPVIKISQLRTNDTESADKASTNIPPQYIIEDGDILFSWSGSLVVVAWCGGKGALNQHLFKVTSEKYPKWFYYYWIKHHLADFQEIAAGKATTMGHIQRHHLKAAKVLVPSDKELKEMDKVMSPLLDKIIINNLESRTLASLRDSLLPKLMKGEVRIKDL